MHSFPLRSLSFVSEPKEVTLSVWMCEKESLIIRAETRRRTPSRFFGPCEEGEVRGSIGTLLAICCIGAALAFGAGAEAELAAFIRRTNDQGRTGGRRSPCGKHRL